MFSVHDSAVQGKFSTWSLACIAIVPGRKHCLSRLAPYKYFPRFDLHAPSPMSGINESFIDLVVPRPVKGPGSRGKYNNACDVCFRKKVKCDGIKPECKPCLVSGRKTECSWNKIPARRPRTEQHFEALHKRAENLQKVLTEHRRYIDLLESLLDQHNAHNFDFRSVKPSMPEGIMTVIEPLVPELVLEIEEDLESDDPIYLFSKGLTVDDSGQLIYHGDTAPFRFLTERQTQPSRFPALQNPDNVYVLIVDQDSEATYNPDFDWSRHLPSAVPLDRRSHDKALDLFFKFFSSWCLRIVPSLFLRDMCRALSVPVSQDPPKTPHYSPMLHNAIIALSLAFLDEPRFRDLKARQYFADKAKSFFEAECQRPNISVVQALSFIASFHSSQGDQTLGYLYFGMSTRVSQALGLNIDCTDWVKSGHMDESDRHDRNWTNWTTFSQDVCWSLYVGRDFTLPLPDLPLPLVDIAHDEMMISYGPNNPVPQPNLMTKTFEATCRLLVISRRIMDVVNRLSKQKSRPYFIDELISEIDVQLNNWKGSLSPDLEITVKSRPTATPQKLMLHLAYWWLFILLHRPFFRRKSRPIASTDREIDHVKLCRRAAENIMENLATWRSLYSLRYVPITLVQTVFSAGIVYLLTAIQASSGVRMAWKEMEHATAQLKLVMEYLQEIGASWQCATNISRILKGLVQDHPRLLLNENMMITSPDTLEVPGRPEDEEERVSEGYRDRLPAPNRRDSVSRSRSRANSRRGRRASDSRSPAKPIPIVAQNQHGEATLSGSNATLAPPPSSSLHNHNHNQGYIDADPLSISIQYPSAPPSTAGSPTKRSFIEEARPPTHPDLSQFVNTNLTGTSVSSNSSQSDGTESHLVPPSPLVFEGGHNQQQHPYTATSATVESWDALRAFQNTLYAMRLPLDREAAAAGAVPPLSSSSTSSSTFDLSGMTGNNNDNTTLHHQQQQQQPTDYSTNIMLGGQMLPQVPSFGLIPTGLDVFAAPISTRSVQIPHSTAHFYNMPGGLHSASNSLDGNDMDDFNQLIIGEKDEGKIFFSF